MFDIIGITHEGERIVLQTEHESFMVAMDHTLEFYAEWVADYGVNMFEIVPVTPAEA
jgi:hypothetical protein